MCFRQPDPKFEIQPTLACFPAFGQFFYLIFLKFHTFLESFRVPSTVKRIRPTFPNYQDYVAWNTLFCSLHFDSNIHIYYVIIAVLSDVLYYELMSVLPGVFAAFCSGQVIQKGGSHWTQIETSAFPDQGRFYCGSCCGQHLAWETCNSKLKDKWPGCMNWVQCFQHECRVSQQNKNNKTGKQKHIPLFSLPVISNHGFGLKLNGPNARGFG